MEKGRRKRSYPLEKRKVGRQAESEALVTVEGGGRVRDATLAAAMTDNGGGILSAPKQKSFMSISNNDPKFQIKYTNCNEQQAERERSGNEEEERRYSRTEGAASKGSKR